MCSDGRLGLTAINLLAPHLTERTAAELLLAAAGRSKREIEELIRARKPLTESIGWVQPLAVQPAPARSPCAAPPTPSRSPAPARVTPIAAERFAVQGTLGQRAADALRFAQDTTGNDLSSILEAALVLYESHLRKRKCGATDRPQRPRPTQSVRHVPAHVRRAVWARDGGRCTFVSEDGHRCGARRRLQYDHVVPIARGGESTADNVRLRCSPHNYHEAERVFGAGFMSGKREQGWRKHRDVRSGAVCG
jgi:5-methylcytosine-specific restriction endonuclease McrA